MTVFVSFTRIVAMTFRYQIYRIHGALDKYESLRNQTDGINSFDFIRKIEGSVLNEQVGRYCS